MIKAFAGIVIFFLVTGLNTAFSQVEYFNQYNESLTKIRLEKVYLHTDRDIYSSNEDLWYKIYLLDGKFHTPLPGENTVFVDLLSPEGKVLLHKPLYVYNGIGNGNFTLGDSLKTGKYELYAYTAYQKNFGMETFFRKEITISQILLNEDKQVITPENWVAPAKQKAKPSVSLQFMPEGGYISDKMVNILAFKTTLPDGKGVNLQGIIFDQNGNFSDSIATTHRGMGKISFRGNSGMKYYAILNDFPSDTFHLPEATDKPQLTLVAISNNMVQFRISDFSRNTDEKIYYLAVKAKGMLRFYFEKKIPNAIGYINIHLKNFEPGLNQVLLMNNYYIPLAERLIYIPGTPQANINLSLSETFKTREKTEIKLSLPDQDDARAGGSFSLAVVNLEQIGKDGIPTENIISYLNLSSEIRGVIEDPAYYFSGDYESVKDELDLLLLTQGWTKYIWDDGYLASLPEFKFENKTGFSIEGQAKRLWLNKGLDEGEIILFIPENIIIKETKTDSIGFYQFDDLVLLDSTKIAVHSRNKTGNPNSRLINANYVIPSYPLYPARETINFSNAELEAYLKNSYQRFVSNSYYNFDNSTILIDEVTIVKEKENEDDGNFRLYSQASNVIDMDEFPNASYSDIFMFLEGMVPGLYITGSTISIRGASGAPLIILDGIEIDIESARTIPLPEIDKIEVLKDASNTAVFGVKGGNGVIAIYTRRGEIIYSEPILFNIITKSIEGYAKAKKFYVPDYENPETISEIIDHRATIFWAPYLTTDSTGTCTVSFFNSDDTGKTIVIAEGILNNGKPGISTNYYWVIKE